MRFQTGVWERSVTLISGEVRIRKVWGIYYFVRHSLTYVYCQEQPLNSGEKFVLSRVILMLILRRNRVFEILQQLHLLVRSQTGRCLPGVRDYRAALPDTQSCRVDRDQIHKARAR